MEKSNVTVALAGNPNCGKTTIFNNITGSRQHIGNYPGVTVERREGVRRFLDRDLVIVDLPGTYSLTAHALDEVVARNVIIDEKPDIILNVVDASNLERNLYLTAQLLELERPMVLGLNMTDVAQSMGLEIQDQVLSEKLGVTVARTIGNRNQGTEDLLKAVVDTADVKQVRKFTIHYGTQIEEKISQIITALEPIVDAKYPVRWLAVKLLENDEDIVNIVSSVSGGVAVCSSVRQIREELKGVLGDDLEMIIAEQRYRFAGELYRTVTKVKGSNQLASFSDKIDKILTHRLLGLPIFFGVMWLLFNFVFWVGGYPQGWIENGTAWLGQAVGSHMADGDLKALIQDGIIGGVGGVITFLPNILLLFLGIALLEDTGYMTRAAFVMDRVMRGVGLHGKSFIPLLLGFGCGVPAIMGARTLENPRDRMVTILISPLMSCSARLPVYTLLIGAFFAKDYAGTVLFSIYILGIVLAVVMGVIFRKYLFAGEREPFVMEMPPYHMPTLKGVAVHMWERSVLYLKKAGTIILAVSIIIWFLSNYPSEVPYSKDFDQAKTQVEEQFEAQIAETIYQPLGIEKLEDNQDLADAVQKIEDVEKQTEEATAELEEGSPELEAQQQEKEAKLAELEAQVPDLYPVAKQYYEFGQQKQEELDKLDKEQTGEKLAQSYAGQLGKAIEPVIKPLGFDWKIGVGLVAGFAAKEVVVSTMGTIYSVGGDDSDAGALQDALQADPTFNPLVAYALMVFVLIYTPCIAALSVIKRETNSWKWMIFSAVYSTVLAWVVTFAVYHIGLMLGY